MKLNQSNMRIMKLYAPSTWVVTFDLA